jgi:type IV pilus assembly protein PilW
MFKTSECIKNDKGFTLVELMVTVLLTAIAVISIYRGYTAFSQSADAQQQVMEMQQNLRIGMTRLAADIRRAGMNEEGVEEAGFIAANATSVEFSMDLSGAEDDGLDNNSDGEIDEQGERDGRDNDDDGEIDEEDELRIGDGLTDDNGEIVKYKLVYDHPVTGVLTDCDAVYNPNQYPCFLYREDINAGTGHKVISNVEAIDFVYFNDTSATPRTVPLDATDLTEVDRVEITLVVRATNEDYRYTNRETYRNLQDDPLVSNPGDNFRRRVFSMSVQIRNNI